EGGGEGGRAGGGGGGGDVPGAGGGGGALGGARGPHRARTGVALGDGGRPREEPWPGNRRRLPPAGMNVEEHPDVGMKREPALQQRRRHTSKMQEQFAPGRIGAAAMARRQPRCPCGPPGRWGGRPHGPGDSHAALLSAPSFRRSLIAEISATHLRRSTCSRSITSRCDQWK